MKKYLFSMFAMVGLAMATTCSLALLTACDDDDDDLTETVNDDSSDTETDDTSNDSSDTDSDDSSSDSSTSTTGTVNGYEYVDLGLSVKWATKNVGAASATAYGYYLAWGEISQKSSYTNSTSKTYGVDIEDISGNATYDAATAKWGSPWRMPTYDEMEELVNECTWTWVRTSLGENPAGYMRVEGPNGNSIILPAAGYYYSTSVESEGTFAEYWSSTPTDYNGNAYTLHITYNKDSGSISYSTRYYGNSVRPVTD